LGEPFGKKILQELKHLSTAREKKSKEILLVVASERKKGPFYLNPLRKIVKIVSIKVRGLYE